MKSNANSEPIKVIHFADLHLGIENYGKIDPKTRLNQRIVDFLKSLNFLINYAKENDVDLVIFAGDAFKNQKPNPTLQREFARAIRQLTKEKIKVVLLVGNHDLPNTTGHAHPMAIYKALELEDVYVASAAEVFNIKTKRGLVQVATLPHFSRSQLVATIKEEDSEYKEKTIAELNDLMSMTIEKLVSNLAANIDKAYPSILTAHISVSTAIVGTESRSILAGSEVTVLPSVLQKPEFDYIALGHIHKFQDLSNGFYPPMVYSGSINRVDFGEEKEEKGFCLVNLARGQTTYNFIPIPTRRFITIDIECKSDNPTEEICSICDRYDIEDSIVRVRIKVPSSKSNQIRKEEILATLERAYSIAYINIETIDETIRLRNPNLTERQTPTVALEEYVKTHEELHNLKEDLLKFGQLLIDEVTQRKT